MRHFDFCRRSSCLMGVVLATISIAACQEPGQQAAAKSSSAAAVPPTASNRETHGPSEVIAYDPGASVKPISNCNLEAIGSVTLGQQPVSLKSGESNVFKGWVYAAQKGQLSYWLRFDDQAQTRYLQRRVELTVPRPDVVAIDADAPLISGFDANLAAGSLPAGKYHVYLAAVTGGVTYICDNGRQILMER